MTRRLLGPFGAATTLSALMVVPATGLLGGQGQSVTSWGHPNLEGIWLDVYSTPFERPTALGDRELATEEERSARDQARMGSQGR
nr:hypothetical protein [Acidimicrobiales bacterium]